MTLTHLRSIVSASLLLFASAGPGFAKAITPADVTASVVTGTLGWDYQIAMDLNDQGSLNRLLIPLLAHPNDCVFGLVVKVNGSVVGTMTPVTGLVGVSDYGWSYFPTGAYGGDAQYAVPPWIMVLDFPANVLDNDLLEIAFSSPWGPTDAPYQAVEDFGGGSYSFSFIDPPIPHVPEPSAGLVLLIATLAAPRRRR